MSYKVSASTLGKSTLASLAEDAAGHVVRYHRHGDPNWVPGCDREAGDGQPHQPNAKAIASKKERVALYCQLRGEGKTRAEAQAEVQVGRSAAKTYENEWLARQRESAQ